MKLKEAIQHAKDKGKGCSLCAKDHRQLSKWLLELKELKELKEYRRRNERITEIPA